MPGIDGKFALL